jgi:signal transduction histidine kinase
VREGVTNVVRHSHARYCTIRIAQEDGTISAEVTDDGSGPAEMEDSAGNGLRGLMERAAHQHGRLEAGPCALGGFRLRVTFPITEMSAAREPERAEQP